MTAVDQGGIVPWVRVVVATARNGTERNEDVVGIDGWVLSADSQGGPDEPIAMIRPFEVSLPISFRRPLVIALADGMSGAPGGALAARIAAETLTITRGDAMNRALAAAAFTEAHRRVREASSAATEGMGCTAAMVSVHKDGAVVVANVGDVRVYRLIDGYAGQLTVDHRPASGGGPATAVTRCVGGIREEPAEPHTFAAALHPGNRLILCTDGVHDARDLTTVSKSLAAASPGQAALDLLLAARERQAGDNATVVVVEIPR